MKNIIKLTIASLLISNVLYASINSKKEIVRIGTVETLKETKRIAEQLNIYDRYIYTTQDTKVPYFILYAVNIHSSDIKGVLKNIKKISPSAYKSTSKSKQYLITHPSSKHIFMKAKVEELKSKVKKKEIQSNKKIEKDGSFYLIYQKPVKKVQITKKPIAEKIIVKKQTMVSKPNNHKYFLGGYIGMTNISTSQNDKVGSISLGTKADTSAMNFGWEAGYKYTKDTFSTISYTQSNFDDIELYNYLLSYNISFPNIFLNPYIGVVGGISYIKLTKSLINGTTQDNQGRENIYGLQAGIEKNIKKDFILFTQYQYLKVKHTTELKASPALSDIVRENQSNIMFGVRWGF